MYTYRRAGMHGVNHSWLVKQLLWLAGRRGRGRLRNVGSASQTAPPLTFVRWLPGPRKEET